MISKSISISKKFNVRLKDHFPRLLYLMLIPHTDDFGRMKGDPYDVKGLVFPIMEDVRGVDIEESLQELHSVGLIVWYEVDGEQFIQVTNFDPHQQGIHKRTRSKFPEPPIFYDNSPGDYGNFRESPTDSRKFPLNRTEENRTELNRREENRREEAPAAAAESIDSESESFFTAYKRVYQRDLTTYQLQQLSAYIDNEGFEEAVVIRAIEKAGMIGGSIGLILKIMNDYAANGAKTLLGAKEYDAQFESKKQGNRNRGSRGGSPKPNLTVVRSDGPAPALSREESARMRELARKLKEEKTRPKTDEEMPDPF